ncbi:MAG: acetyl-CoA carboxylase biotin carboxyl carrier protein subunit [Anaerolineae bacterium]|jgi:biotin carboxyl carrier protein|nr:MAG: acetyl-CoA carboxylase biotin carboxyl carrier protein subunit [Anaerolineae bacterium]
MKYKVKIHDKLFEVEIESLDQRPIRATVDGYTYEVYPVEEKTEKPQKRTTSGAIPSNQPTITPAKTATANAFNTVKSPIPGIVTRVEVMVGQEVKEGDPLCVIEAMKMKNTIRSPRSGVIKFIPIEVGKHVRHNEVLIEFEGDSKSA